MSVLSDQNITEPAVEPTAEQVDGSKYADGSKYKYADGSTPPAKATQSTGFGVVASPFNGIKIELGICIVLGALLWLGADSITADEGAQLLMLLSYGLLTTGWLVLRTRAVLRRCEAEHSA